MKKIKKCLWLAVRVVVLGPLATGIVLGEWCSELFPQAERFINTKEKGNE